MSRYIPAKTSPAQNPLPTAFDYIKNKYPKIKKAYLFAQNAHKGQKRKSGEDYFSHCLKVAEIVSHWILDNHSLKDVDIVSAALLHDVTEETSTKLKTIEKIFGKEVAKLVDGVSKFKSKDENEEDLKTRKKIVIKGYLDPRVFVLKLADRLHNMTTLNYLPKSKQIQKSLETQNLYSKLAEALGMWEVKTLLEDLSFKYLRPKEYKKMEKIIENDPRLRIAKQLRKVIYRLCLKEGLSVKIVVRKNGYWQIKKKLDKNLLFGSSRKAIQKIEDIVSIRVLTNKIRECYLVLGLIEEHFREKIDTSTFDNFLIKPVINGYSALHTCLITKAGLIEIAITTVEKENFNMYGFLDQLKRGSHNNYKRYLLRLVFDKNGSIYFMQRNSTGLDFAYLLPDLAPSARKVLIDGKPYPLNKNLPNGATVEIIYSINPKRAPNKDLINYASDETRAIIERQLELLERDKILENGKKKLEKLLIPRGLLALEDTKTYSWRLIYLTSSENLDQLILKYSLSMITQEEMEELLDQVGLTKQKTKFSTILVSGKNQPGVLARLTRLVAKEGGDIINMNQTISRQKYSLRILIRGLAPQSITKIEKKLIDDSRFEKVLIV